MKSVRLFVLAAILMLVVLPLTGGGTAAPPGPSYVPGEVLLKFKVDAQLADKVRLMGELGATELHQFVSGAVHWKLAPGLDVLKTVQRLKLDPSILYAEPNFLLSADVIPNDPRFPELWGMNNTGQTGGTPDADIDADLAWGVSTGSSDVLVAVIDTGVDYNHPDLAENIWTNPGEIPGNSIDDDGNGYVDDVHGYDFYNNDGDPFDDNGHGTHVSGTIGAVGNNGIGVAGVNWHVKIMAVKFLGSGGSGSTANAILSVQYVTAMHARLSSNSWGGGSFSQALYDAIAAAGAANIAFVAAAGNNGANSDTSPAYPAAYDLPNIISVAATDKNDQLASFSNYGAVSVDLAAPGVDVLSTQPGNQYQLLSGTSMATPHVSGVYALILSVSAPNIPVAQVKNIILSSVDHIPAMNGKCVSNGRLNAFFAIAEPDTTPPGMINDLGTTDPGSNTVGLTWTATGDDGAVGTASSYEVRYSDQPITSANWPDATRAGNEPTPGPSGTAEAMEVRNLSPSTIYYFAVKAFDEWGNAGPLSNIATAQTLPPPTGQADPTSVSADLYTGQQTDRSFTLSNVGDGTLDFTIPPPALAEPMAPNPFMDLAKDEPDPRHGDPVTAGFGGPDAFGYRWSDSDQPGGPVFNWTDISTTGTLLSLTGDDATSTPVALGFNFPFYGTLYPSVRVCTNGWLSFTSTATSYSNQPLPNTGAPDNLVAPFWDDLNVTSGGQVFFQSFGTKAIIQWNNVPRYSSGGPYTFQAILEAGGAITFQYLTMNAPLDGSTIGIQNADKSVGLQVAFNQAYLHNNMAVRISSIPQWITPFPTSGRLRAGESKTINLHMDASGLEGGTYPAAVNILTNDPAHPTLVVNASLHVIGAPDASVQPTSLDYGQRFIGQPYHLTLIVANIGTDTLHVTSIAASDPSLVPNPAVFDVPPHGSQNVDVTWTPPALGPYTGLLTVNSNDASEPAIPVPVTGEGIAAPIMIYDPLSFYQELYSGLTATQNLTVTNTGGSNLSVDAAADLGGSLVYADDVGINGAGGPDSFGYRWKDSDASGGPTFNFIDISSTGTAISFSSSDDALSAAIPMGMTFPFYGSNFSSVKVGTNGFLTFDTTDTSTRLSNYPLPNTNGAKYMLALLWDDLHLRSGNVKYKYDGTRFIVQYTNVEKYSPSGFPMTFQVQLYPNGKILYMYKTMPTGGTYNSLTIGIQDGTKTVGLTANYNTNYVHANMAIQFSRTPDWLAVTPSHATVPPNGSFTFTVTFDSHERLGGYLNGAVVLTTNIPSQQTTRIPAQLRVIGAPIASIVPASYAYGTRYTGYSYLTSFQVVNTGTDVLNVTDVFSDNPALTVEEPAAADGENVIPESAFPLPPGASRLFNLRWAPTAPGPLNANVHVLSDDPQNSNRLMPVTGTAILPPVAVWSPTSFTVNLDAGVASHSTLHLENQGGSDLNWVSQISLQSGATVVVDHSPELKKDEPDTRPGMLGSGGPDVFGYTWKDSDQTGGPTFNWFDIGAIGTPITFTSSDDSNVGPFNLGFPFPFYGQTFSQVRVCTNGFLSFTDSSTALSNYPLPSTNGPANLLAVFWDDLHQRNGNAKYYTDGNRFIVQWTNWDKYSPSGQLYTFQVQIFRNGRILYQYLSMTTGALNSATIGIQNASKDDGLTVDYNANYVHNNLAVEFRPPSAWLSLNPEAGTIPPGGATDLDVTLDATDLIGGDYSAFIDINTNDPARGLIRVPVSLHVTGIPDIDVQPTSLNFPMTYLGYWRTLSYNIRNVGTDVLYLTGASISGDFQQDGFDPSTPIPPGGSVPITITFTPTAVGLRTGEMILTSNDPDEPSVTIPFQGTCLAPPELHVAPTSVADFLPPASTKTRTIQVCNTGGSDLNWSSGTNIISGNPAVTQYGGTEIGKDEPDTNPGILGTGGPDAFGYRWRDSDAPGGPTFVWEDITGTGTRITALNGDDQNVQGIPLGFTFKFYGQSFNTLNVSSNGFLSFTNTTSALTNYALPSTSAPENLLAAFWDDLDMRPTSGNGAAYYWSDGNRFILSYITVPRYSTHEAYTFQVILTRSGKITFQYLTMTPGRLNEATIGIQNAAKNDGLTVVYNATYVHDNMAVEFKAIPEWAMLSPTSGVVVAGTCQDVTLTLDSADLDHGVHNATLHIQANNDPYLAYQDVPVTLTVNHKPVAEAGMPQTLECTGNEGAYATLDGSGSSDADNDPITYAWTAPGVTFNDPTSATPTGFFHLGTTTASLVVNDGYENSAPDTVGVTVADTTPPSIACPASVTNECQANRSSVITLPPATASDVCSGVTITNNHNGGGANASGTYPLGTTVVTFTATDSSGNTSSCSTSVTVVDTIPPAVSVATTPTYLWPPNHMMSTVNASVVVTDACDPTPATILVSVVSSEPDDAQGGGDGHTTNDIQDAAVGTLDLQVLLRSEREGAGSGRVYTLTYRATDQSGNASLSSAAVQVPHDLGSVVEPLDLVISDKTNTRVSWGTVQGAVDYDVIRGDVANLRIQGSNVDLGRVTCIERNSIDTTTSGNEDTVTPAPGQVFFYAVQFYDGYQESSYGSENVGRARVIQPGNGNCP